jgi:hypothetical protein
MNKLFDIALSFAVFALFCSVLMAPLSLWAQAGAVEVSAAVHHDVSPPLWSIQSQAPRLQPREKPVHPLPLGPAGQLQPDPVLQSTPSFAVSTTAGLNFAGVGNGDYGFSPNAAPPDTNGAVGATQYVQWVNESFAVFDKTTGAIASGFPKTGNTLWSGFGGGCQTNNDGDPIVQYDKINGRWIFTQFSVSTTPFLQCVAVSQTSDATGSYNRYAFNYGSTGFPDYPKLGVWPDAYYISFNIFTGNTFSGAKVCAYDSAAMRAGTAATQVCFQLSSSFGGLLPSDLDGSTAPPAGAPNAFVNFGTNSLNVWRFHVDFGTPTNSTLTGPLNLAVAAFSPACNGGGACIPQPNTSQKLDSLADRLMYRFAYRNGTTAGSERAVVNHSVKVSGNHHAQVTGVRWYQLANLTSGTPAVVQQGTFSPDSNSRWMGSIAMDKVGDIAVGYSVSSGSTFPSVHFSGRVPGDPLGTLEAENLIKAGGGSQLPNLARWGDYSAMSVDPVDDCTFFYTTEYLKSSGTFNWSTQIASFKFTGCP